MTVTATSHLVLRRAEPTDISTLLRIERSSGQEDLYDENDFAFLMKDSNHGCLVGTLEGKIIGYMAYRAEPTYDLLLCVVIQEKHRRQGHGSHLANVLSRRTTLAVCREYNLLGQQFLRGSGFKYARTVVDAYECPPENGYVFEKTIAPPPESPVRERRG